MAEKVCTCAEFLPNMEKMGGIFVLAHVHGVNYNGAAFVYCPWCGGKLRDGEIEIRQPSPTIPACAE